MSKVKPKQESFFFRFYGREESEIAECLEEMKKYLSPTRTAIRRARYSANWGLTDEFRPVMELILWSDAETIKRLNDRDFPEVLEVYQKWSIKNRPEGLKSETVVRRSGELAFGV